MTVTINMVLFLITMFKDPGIKSSIYDHHIKILDRCKSQEVVETEMEVEEDDGDLDAEDDLEGGGAENAVK